jgi:hypothetical protein
MKLTSIVFLTFLLPSLAWSQTKIGNTGCANDAMLLSADTLKKSKIQIPVVRHYCYSDKTGNYVLYLAEKQDLPYASRNLSTIIEAHLFKLENDQTLSSPIIIRDSAKRPGVIENEAGVTFWQQHTEIKDIDADGNMEAILVYRIYAEDDLKIRDDPYFGRLKIVMFYKGSKVVIRATTGPYHGDAFTTASENFFSLPKSIQEYLARKMKKMSEDKLFAFDNKHNYMPLKVREPYKEF